MFLQDTESAIASVTVWPNYMISEYIVSHTDKFRKKIDITYATCVENH